MLMSKKFVKEIMAKKNVCSVQGLVAKVKDTVAMANLASV